MSLCGLWSTTGTVAPPEMWLGLGQGKGNPLLPSQAPAARTKQFQIPLTPPSYQVAGCVLHIYTSD